MSTIAVTNVKHPSAVDPAIVLDADGGVSVAGMGLVLVKPTSIANSGGSASLSGGAVTFTAVNSVSLNGCFTSAYQNYAILITATGSTTAILDLRLRASGTDSGTSYQGSMVRFSAATSTTAYDTAVTDLIKIGVVRTNGLQVANITIATPQTETPTRLTGTHIDADQAGVIGGIHSAATSFDGFTIYPASGTITGTIRCYGYQDS